MKKLLTVTCLAGLLSIPSVVFAAEAEPEEVISDEIMSAEAEPEEVISDEIMSAEAEPVEPELSPEMQGHISNSHSGALWYGSIRAGVTSASGGGTSVTNFGSRWGIHGSSQVAEGLTAFYKFEQGFNSATGEQDDARLSYLGLSGGFGSLTIGRINSASGNTVGKITNTSYSQGVGGAGVTSRIGSAVSYALDVSGVKLQADVVMDSALSGNDIDQVEFGISVPVGDIGKIAFAHIKKPGYTTTEPYPHLDVVVSGMIGKLALEFKEPVKTVASLGVSSSGESTVTIPKITLKDTTAFEIDSGKVTISLPSDSTLLELEYTYEDTAKDLKGDPIKGEDGTEVKVSTSVKLTDVWIQKKVKGENDAKGNPTLVDNTAHEDKQLSNYFEITHKTDLTKSGTYHKDCLDRSNPKDIKLDAADCVKKTQYTYDANVNNLKESTVAETVLENVDVAVASIVTLATGTATVKTDIPELDVTINGNTVDKELTLTGKAEQKYKPDVVKDYRSNHIAAQATLGAVTGYLGWSETDTGGVKEDVTQFGISGALGDTGLSYLLEAHHKKDASPWAVGLYKTLGGGAFAAFEHGNNGTTGTSVAFIGVDF